MGFIAHVEVKYMTIITKRLVREKCKYTDVKSLYCILPLEDIINPKTTTRITKQKN